MREPSDVAGPIIVWRDYGCEGWQPTSYPTLAEALAKGSLDGLTTVATVPIDIAKHVIEPVRYRANEPETRR
jgi:hypothetical protein